VPLLANGAWGWMRGAYFLLANAGASGVVALLLIWTFTTSMPAMQQGFHDELKAEREMFREELKALRSHDTRENNRLADGIREVREAIERYQHDLKAAQTQMGDAVRELSASATRLQDAAARMEEATTKLKK
jgi:chromosome segregation ATPase